MSDDLALVWFRRDLRLDDNPAWAEATSRHRAVLAVHVLEPSLLAAAGAHRRRRFLHDLAALDRRLREAGGTLVIHTGDAAGFLPALAAQQRASVVYANADVTPFATARDRAVEATCRAAGVELRWSWGTLVHPPGAVRTAAGTLSQVFTPFHKVWEATPRDEWPAPGPAQVVAGPGEDLPVPDGPYPLVGGEAGEQVEPGERGARARLDAVLARVDDYADQRDRPDRVGSSQLSPDLRFGTLSPRTAIDVVGVASRGRAAFVRQLAWRDWYAHTLLERPGMVDQPLKAAFARLPWREDPDGLEAWQHGRTGVPLVDAGMRQLLETGWMHNRVRMVAGSFLTKNLLIDWRRGERWFRHHLIDGDVAQNVGNWQWVAGTGPDASPFHRVFNPVLQGRKFDPEGAYVRRWVPELARLGADVIHAPWEAGPLDLAEAGVELGVTYPEPIVDLRASRERALAVHASIRG
jgi:deoxyribodipyrimidine photo-lyase